MTARPGCVRVRRRGVGLAVAAALAVLLPAGAGAAPLITGGEGNKPIGDPGWPAGGAALINSKARVAWWEGPPFGGGQWHAECRGDARAVSAALADFARLDSANRRVVVHEGVGASFWLNPNRDPGKAAAARIDWTVSVWQADRWKQLGQLPPDLNPVDPADRAKGPPAVFDVYTGGQVRWADVVVPEGLTVVDERLETHGFTADDGVVLEGRVTDLPGGGPVAARVSLERVEPQAKGGYRYTPVAGSAAGADGRWVLKSVPVGWFRIVAAADGYAPRVTGYVTTDTQPKWSRHDTALARPAFVSGRVADGAGVPLAGVTVSAGDVATEATGRYEGPAPYESTTDAEGRFRIDGLPAGKAAVWVHKEGYVRPGLGQPVATPAEGLVLTMNRSAGLRVKVDFTGVARPTGYVVKVAPEGGERVGTWGGSANLDNNDQFTFKDAPPGRYVVQGQPNPGSDDQVAGPVTVELKGGETAEVTLRAR